MDEYRIRFGLRIEMQVERGEITVEEAIAQVEQQDQSFNQYVRALLTEDQQELFFGGFSSEEGHDGIYDDEDASASITLDQEDVLNRYGSVYIPVKK